MIVGAPFTPPFIITYHSAIRRGISPAVIAKDILITILDAFLANPSLFFCRV
jgi:hypothetical protein